jgi:zinc-ribbon domain
MFCPKCGVQLVETTKYCKSCGLALGPMADFVAKGGLAPLGASSLNSAFSGFSSWQKVWLASLAIICSPFILPLAPFLFPIAIVWMALQYKLQKRQLDALATIQPMVQPAVQPDYIQQPRIQPLQANLLYESRQSVLQTGSLISEATPGSVVEDDTRRLQNQ